MLTSLVKMGSATTVRQAVDRLSSIHALRSFCISLLNLLITQSLTTFLLMPLLVVSRSWVVASVIVVAALADHSLHTKGHIAHLF